MRMRYGKILAVAIAPWLRQSALREIPEALICPRNRLQPSPVRPSRPLQAAAIIFPLSPEQDGEHAGIEDFLARLLEPPGCGSRAFPWLRGRGRRAALAFVILWK